jgi:hypothetical protein
MTRDAFRSLARREAQRRGYQTRDDFSPLTRGGQGRSAEQLEEGAWQTLLMVAFLLAAIAACFFFGGAP